ncbi:MarC family protein [Saprospiraceae bacterium]|jgi:multiple antibiotic resistance protein|nr:MarC family protein [Bacteroidota bacterium]MDB4727196.1 MarC family protein [Saprospiraceae bacterium]MDF1868610.1 MarC family protein [Saprospiraceae bacterium]
MNLAAILTVSLILFSVIDIIGSLPVIINMKKEGLAIRPSVATGSAGLIMLAFLFFGASILGMFGLEVSSFALAGALIIFFIGLEMILGIRFFRNSHEEGGSGSIVPIAFPLLAGAGTLTTIISLKAEYDNYSILAGILINLIIVYFVLRSTGWLSRKMSHQIAETLRKVFGIILIAIAIQMAKEHLV